MQKLCLALHSATLPDCHAVKGNKELVVFAQKIEKVCHLPQL